MIRNTILLAVLLCGNVYAQAPQTRGKVLIAYFSLSGNTRSLARQIQTLTGGDLFEITTVQAYPAEYRAATEVAKSEQKANARPALASRVNNMAAYDTVILGFPSWWGTMPMAVFTFLESYDFSGKTIIPFITHGGSGFGRSERDIAKTAPSASLKKGFALRGSQAAEKSLNSWLKEAGALK